MSWQRDPERYESVAKLLTDASPSTAGASATCYPISLKPAHQPLCMVAWPYKHTCTHVHGGKHTNTNTHADVHFHCTFVKITQKLSRSF